LLINLTKHWFVLVFNHNDWPRSRVGTFFWTIPTKNVKNLNKHAVVDLIRFTAGGISRIEISRQMNLTRAAITTIVSDLQSAGLVREVESHYPSGRRPIVLEINPDRGYVVGVDLGATHVTILVTDFLARVVRELDAPLDIHDGPQVCLPQVETLVHQALAEVGLSIKDVSAIGAGVPGPVVAGMGVSGPPIMPGWDGYRIREDLEKRFGVPVSLSNDAELGAVGEWAYGAGRGERHLAYIKVGTGIGAGLLLEGQVYGGATGSAGEIGHITIEQNGPICTCGNHGCLEALAGGRAISNRAIQEVQNGRRTLLAEISPVSRITSRDVIAAARRGDLVSQQIVSEAGVYLGTALASLVNLFNPSMVVVGGGVAQIGDLLLEPIRATIRQRSLLPASRSVRITTALLGRRSSAMGAVVQALTIVLHQLADHD
jgi:glucokinase-like ROK family protein